MRKSILKFSFLTVASWIFTWLLFKEHTGINLPIFESVVILGLLIIFRAKLQKGLWLPACAWILSSLAVIFINTGFSVTMNIIVFVMFSLRLLWHEISHPLLSFLLGIMNIYRAQRIQWQRFFVLRKEKGRGARLFRFMLIGSGVLLVLILFFILYNASNIYFNQSISWLVKALDQSIKYIFGEITFGKIMFFILGFTMVSALSVRNSIFKHLTDAQSKSPALLRHRRHLSKEGLRKSLIHERNFGIALLIGLNLLILLQNILDIKNIWFDFIWDGKVLKQFVHEGTYILILSIFLSAAIVLYLFRKNQNFFINNRWLRILTFLWLGQNAILAISVGMRNFWYIHYFNLAYLRIGVFIFLVLVLTGLSLVVYKIIQKQSSFSIWGKGITLCLYILLFFSFFPWDMIIVRHNIKHAQEAYFHHDFMVTLADKTLGSLKENEDIFDVKTTADTLNIYTREYFGRIDTSATYRGLLYYRCERFKSEWKKRNWISWNYPEAEAYRKLAVNTH